MYQEIFAFGPQNSTRKKPRLSISQVAFHTEKLKISQHSLKPQIHRKFSQINLKDALLSGLNADNPTANIKININVDPEQQNTAKVIKRSRSNSKHWQSEINQNFIVKHLENQANNLAQRSVNKSRQKISPDNFLPSIFKNSTIEPKSNSIRYPKNDESKKAEDQKRFVSLELENVQPSTRENNVGFKKLRSESLIHLQNKLKLQKAKVGSRNQDKELENSDEKQTDLPRSNTQKVCPTFPKEVSPSKKQKKFYINNLSLQTSQAHAEGLQKRNYILKFLQKHEKQLLPKQQNRKNSYFNVMEKERTSEKPNPKNFYSSQNLISRKMVFSNPDEMLLKKIEISGGKSGKEKHVMKYESQKSKKVNQGKVKKDCINGWDFDDQYGELAQVDERE